MRHPDDREYYACRTQEEMDCGDSAADPTAAAVHYELAYRYSVLAGRPDLGIPNLSLVLGAKDRIAA